MRGRTRKIQAQIYGLDGNGFDVEVKAVPWIFLGQVDYTISFKAGSKVVYTRKMKGASKQAVERAAKKFFKSYVGNRKCQVSWVQYPWE